MTHFANTPRSRVLANSTDTAIYFGLGYVKLYCRHYSFMLGILTNKIEFLNNDSRICYLGCRMKIDCI